MCGDSYFFRGLNGQGTTLKYWTQLCPPFLLDHAQLKSAAPKVITANVTPYVSPLGLASGRVGGGLCRDPFNTMLTEVTIYHLNWQLR